MGKGDSLSARFGEHWATQLFATMFALLFGGALLWLCRLFADTSRAVGVNILLCILGALLGWALGMFFSPFNTEDAAQFKFLGKTVAAFVSGYLLSKGEAVLGAYLKRATEHPEQVQWDRVGLLSCSFLLAFIVVFVSRTYAHASSQPKEEVVGDAA
jgi:4-amino-4-deoxy-L-arabinose transferase-like glycosyltransferase